MKTTLTTYLLLSPFLYGASIDFAADNGAAAVGFSQGDAIDLDGNRVDFGAGGGNLLDLSGYTGAYTLDSSLTNGAAATIEFTMTNGSGGASSYGAGDNNSGAGIQNGQAGFTFYTADQGGTNSTWGGVIGGAGQPSALAIQATGGSIDQVATANVLGVNIDFDQFGASGVNNVQFTLGGISSLISNSLDNQDILNIRAFGVGGVAVPLVTSTAGGGGNVIISTTPTFLVAGSGTSELTLTGILPPPAGLNDHTDAITNAEINLGSTAITRLEIDFAPDVNGTGNFTSAGFGIGNFNFDPVPEPSSALLALLGGLCLMKRKR